MHKHTARWMASAALLTAGAVVLAGCGRAADTETDTSGPTSVDVSNLSGSLEVWAIGNEGELLPELATAFEEAYPEVDVTVTAIPWEGYQDKLRTAVAGGQAPDISMVGNPFAAVLAPTGALDPVPTDFIDSGAFFEGSWNASVIDGTSYAVPWYIDTRVLYYRTDMAEQAGVGAPESWEGLRELAAGLQSAGAEQGFYLQPSGNRNSLTLLPMVWQAGGDLMNDDLTEFTIDTPEWTEALEYYASFHADGLSGISYYQTGEYEPRFVEGSIGSFVSGPFDVAMVQDQAGDDFDALGLAPWPQKDGGDGPGTGYVGGGDLVVFKDTDNRNAAWAFVKWLSEPDTQVEWFEISGDLPSTHAAWEDDVLADDPYVSVFGEQMNNVQALPGISTISQVLTAIDVELEKVVRGVTTPADAAAEMQRQADSIGTGK